MATRTRKKKEAEAPAPAVFTVGEQDALLGLPESDEPRPEIQEETIEGLIRLREHLTRVPSGVTWALKDLKYLSDFESAAECVENVAMRHALSTSKWEELRWWIANDAYAFGYLVCRHRDMDPSVHMPLAYAAAGQAQKLAWCLSRSGLEGYVIDQHRNACRMHGIDYETDSGIQKLDTALDWVNFRLPRGVYKSSIITHTGVAVTITLDPNTTNSITGAIDDKAFELCEQVGETLLSGAYRDLYPERVPGKSDVAMKRIKVPGRTVSSREKTVQAGGYLSKNETGGHFDRRWIDDLVVGGKNGNANPTQLPGVRNWLTNLPHTFIMSRRNRVVHCGTRWDKYDDHGWLTEPSRASQCMSVVVPIEIHTKKNPALTERGIPTMPNFLPTEKIQQKQDWMMSNEDDSEWLEAWRCNNLLDPSADGGIVFSDEAISDPARTWLGPFEHPKSLLRKGAEIWKPRFLVARKETDDKGERVVSFCPWEQMDMVVTVSSSWLHGARDWAVTAAAIDPKLVRYQLETRTGKDGVDGWVAALADMTAFYRPRTIGLDHAAFSDNGIQNRMLTDARLRLLARRIVSIQSQTSMQASRVSASVAEPFGKYQLLLLPKCTASENDHGYSATRREMSRFRVDMDGPTPVLESLAMVTALMRRVPTLDERKEQKRADRENEMGYRQSLGELGIPRSAVA